MRGDRPVTSQYKGVRWKPNRQKWYASIARDKKYHHLGVFDNEMEAAKAYDAAARHFHGEYAKLNFPNEGETSFVPPLHAPRTATGYYGVSQRGSQWGVMVSLPPGYSSDGKRELWLGLYPRLNFPE